MAWYWTVGLREFGIAEGVGELTSQKLMLKFVSAAYVVELKLKE